LRMGAQTAIFRHPRGPSRNVSDEWRGGAGAAVVRGGGLRDPRRSKRLGRPASTCRGGGTEDGRRVSTGRKKNSRPKELFLADGRVGRRTPPAWRYPGRGATSFDGGASRAGIPRAADARGGAQGSQKGDSFSFFFFFFFFYFRKLPLGGRVQTTNGAGGGPRLPKGGGAWPWGGGGRKFFFFSFLGVRKGRGAVRGMPRFLERGRREGWVQERQRPIHRGPTCQPYFQPICFGGDWLG